MKKAMMVTWSDSEESSEEEKEKEVANMCFMAIDDLDEAWRPPWENCKLKIEGNKKKLERIPRKKKSPLALPPPHQVQGESSQDLPKDWKFVINHPQDQIIEFSKCMHSEFEMSMMGELNFFLRLQIKQLKEGTFINQAKYIRDLLKRFNMEEAKTMKTLMSSSIKLDKDEKGKSIDSTMYRGMIGLLYPKGDNFELIGYSDADFAGCKVERKSTSDTCHFLGHSLVSWHSKKQNSVALSTAEAEYIAAAAPQGIFDAITAFWRGALWCVYIPLFSFVSFISTFLMVPRRELAASKAQGKRPTEPSQPDQSETRRKARKVVPERSINFSQFQYFGFEGIFGQMRWLPVDRSLSTVRGVEITLGSESIFRILNIPSVGLRVYESKVWPTVPGFEPKEAIQRCVDLSMPRGMGKPSAHSLTMISRILHHMVCSILLPRGGHRDEVSYLEAFIVDSIMIGRRIHVGYLMMMHMISCYESKTLVLPYGRFLTRVFKDAGFDLSRETNFEAPTTRAEQPSAQDRGWKVFSFEASFPESMISEPAYTAGPSEPFFTEPSHAENTISGTSRT
ncbi:hypothetical protein CK203_015826 [Vitis vinifera]|uniref:Putative plant transposon protein domain-containing protein n=1 Tax=Vitis vinifera TaxID=29760 RepID=A0A438JRC5_VITVI|nr:hypothetical protein CK203_015826 [Vitis vinifera]